jgi:AcrR family transcriptional regulator
VSKMTFYRHFPNKIELAKAVFDKVVDEGNARFKRILFESKTSENFVKNLLLLKQETTENISREFLQDFYSHPELGLKEYVDKKTHTEWVQVLKELKKAQKKGFFRSDINLEFFFQLAMKMSEVVSDQSFIKNFKRPQDMIMELAKLLTYGITVHEKN